jgi:hypothetical protein
MSAPVNYGPALLYEAALARIEMERAKSALDAAMKAHTDAINERHRSYYLARAAYERDGKAWCFDSLYWRAVGAARRKAEVPGGGEAPCRDGQAAADGVLALRGRHPGGSHPATGVTSTIFNDGRETPRRHL